VLYYNKQHQQHHHQQQYTNLTTPPITTATLRINACTCLHACMWVLMLVDGVGACVVVGGLTNQTRPLPQQQ
jgi:hypothetical protein